MATFDEFIREKCTRAPSYCAEYRSAIALFARHDESSGVRVAGKRAIDFCLGGGAVASRARAYVVSEFSCLLLAYGGSERFGVRRIFDHAWLKGDLDYRKVVI